MIVIELEEKKYDKTMEAVSKIKEYAECLTEMLEEHSMGQRMGSGMGQRKHYEDEDYEDYGNRRPRREYRGNYRGEYKGDYDIRDM